MRVGVPKEIKKNEHRIGLTPTAVREYVAHGHDVTVEAGEFLRHIDSDGEGRGFRERAVLGHVGRDAAPECRTGTAGTQETAYVAVLDGDDVVYIARSGVHRHMNTGYMLGSRVQAHVTAAGIVIRAI